MIDNNFYSNDGLNLGATDLSQVNDDSYHNDVLTSSANINDALGIISNAFAELEFISELALETAHSYLNEFALESSWETKIESVFGTDYSSELIERALSKFQLNDFSDLPSIKIIPSQNLEGANGGYDDLNGLIYLSSDFIANNQHDPEEITRVVLEEIGHFLDAKINQQDTPGDEGAIFAAKVLSLELETGVLDENDFNTITIGDRTVQIEQSTSDGAGNSLASARDLGTFTGGQTFKDRITRSDRQDYYKFTLDTFGKVNFGLTGLKANANIMLLDSNGNSITGGFKGGRKNEFGSADLEAGDYYLRVYRKNGNTNYKLNLSFDGAGNSLASARDLGTFTGGQTFQDRITGSDRQDYYKFTLDTFGKVNFGLTGLKANANIMLLDSNGNSIIGGFKGGRKSEFGSADLEAGDYYLRVYRKNGNTNYKLNLDVVDKPEITLTSPNGEDKLIPGEDFNITWDDNIDESVKIELYKGDFLGVTIADNTPSDGSYTFNWTNLVAENDFNNSDAGFNLSEAPIAYGTDYKLKISSVNNNDIYDISNNYFTIGQPQIEVNLPSGGDKLELGKIVNITWKDNIDDAVNIDLYQDDVLVRNIASNTASDGQVNWTVPTNLPVGDRYKIKISQAGDDAIADFSNDYFSIFRPEIAVTSPNGGDKLTPGENFNITWNDNIDEDVRIDLYVRSDTAFVQTITDKTFSDGNFLWNVPVDLPTDAEYKISVTSFSNPATTDTSDDYFSMKLEAVHKVDDFNGDGKHDILWRNYENGHIHAWQLDGLAWQQDIDLPDITDSAVHPVATGDFNNDGHTDIVTRYYWKDNPGHTQIWLMNRDRKTQVIDLLPTVGDPNWHISGTGDFNKDGNIDLLWRNYQTGENHVWMMNGTSYVESVSLLTVKDPNWKIVGTGDFDRDGNIDIVWRNGNANSIWMMDGTERREYININSTDDPDWKIVGTGDFDRDGNIDLLLREHNVGNIGVWLMNGTERIGIEHSPWGVHHPSYHVVGQSDPIPTWTAEYFNNKDLSGNPVHVEGVGNSYHAKDVNVLSLNWGLDSPANTPTDNFSARFTTRRYLEPGLYQIQTGSDDGIRVIIDGQKVTDRWVDRGITVDSDSGYFYSTGKEHDIKIEYYEHTGGAAIDFKIRKANPIDEPTDGSVWRASIYNWNPTEGSQPPQDFFMNGNEAKKIGSVNLGSHTRSDGKFGLAVDWQDGAIDGDSRLPHDNFAIRAYTHKHLEAGKTYKAHVKGDDGYQLFASQWHTGYKVDMLTNRREESTQWEQNYGGYKTYEFTVDHTGWYDLHIEMYEAGGLSEFDFVLDEGSGGSYYPELAGLSDDEWDRQSGDDNQFRSDSPWGGGDRRDKTDDRIEQIYTDLSNAIFGTRHHMTSGYAYDESYYNGFGLWHAGIDLGAPVGTSVKAILGGTVAWVSNPGTNDSFIGINSDDGRQWVYGHVGNLNVKPDQRVNAGDNIAKIGYQNHLHLEVENGHAYGGTQGAHSNQDFVRQVTVSPLQAYWELRNESTEIGIISVDISDIMSVVPSDKIVADTQNHVSKIVDKASKAGLSNAQIAYVLATVEHESRLGQWMEEFASGSAYEWRTDLGNIYAGDGVRFKGRGYVQITGRSNYQYWTDRLGIDLVGNPELAENPDIAAEILVYGMRDGTFTGVRLDSYINNSGIDFFNARRIVNGTDRAALIADYANNYYNALT